MAYEFVVLDNEKVENLQEEINYFLEYGWELHGGMLLCPDFRGEWNAQKVYYEQVMRLRVEHTLESLWNSIGNKINYNIAIDEVEAEIVYPTDLERESRSRMKHWFYRNFRGDYKYWHLVVQRLYAIYYEAVNRIYGNR